MDEKQEIKELDTRFQIVMFIIVVIIMVLTWHISNNSERIEKLEKQLEPKDSAVIIWEKKEKK